MQRESIPVEGAPSGAYAVLRGGDERKGEEK